MMLVLFSGLMLALVQMATDAFRIGMLDYANSRAFYAAEGGVEAAMGQIAVAIEDGELAADEVAEIQPPELEGFSFDSFEVRKVGGIEIETITDGSFAGLYSLTQNVEVYSEAREPLGSTQAVLVSAKAQAIPIFQFGVFFEKDLEATNGPPMEFDGWVHSNGNIYLSSDNAWYRDQITTPNDVVWDRMDHHGVRPGVFVNDAAGSEVRLDFDSRSHPNPADFRAESQAKFDGRVKTGAFDVDSLKVPLPPGMDPVEVLMPREDGDSEMERRAKMSWKADLHVVVDLGSLSRAGDVCGTGIPYAAPDEVVAADLGITGLSGICPGAAVTFTVSHPELECSEFDGRALLTVEWGNEPILGPDRTMDGCEFTVTPPAGVARDLTIRVLVDGDGYDRFDRDQRLDVRWLADSIADNCGAGRGGGGSRYGANGFNTPYPRVTITRSGGLEVPDQPELCQIFLFDWAAFFDGRERDYRDVMNVDVLALSEWVAGDPSGRTSEVIYVEFLVPNSVNGSVRREVRDGSYDPAVRMLNGTVLPNRLTVATHYPVYVQGDYNAVDWKPAAVMGDAITMLSGAWLDSEHRAAEVIETDAASTEYWMAVLAGHSATPCDHEEPGCPGGYTDFYGGGIENYLRFLERWTGRTATYRGSLVSLHVSATVDGTWNGSYYSPPNRDWIFDMRFEDPANLPPGTPTVGNVIHTAFRPVY